MDDDNLPGADSGVPATRAAEWRVPVERVLDAETHHPDRWPDLHIRAARPVVPATGATAVPTGPRRVEPSVVENPQTFRELHAPDWWLSRMARREQSTGALPPALTLQHEDARLEDALDREPTEAGVRAIVDAFNRLVVEARRQLMGGPPVITPTRDADREVELWRERRALR